MKPRVLILIGCSLLVLAIIWLVISDNREGPQSVASTAASPRKGVSTGFAANKTTGEAPSTPTTSRSVAGTTPPAAPLAVTTLPWVSSAGGGGGVANPPRAGAPPVPIAPAPTGKVAEAWADLDKTNRMLRDYRTLMGENPVGTNAEIMKAIMGANPKGATLGPPDGMSLNGSGELIDQWGTPLFFHQISGTHMEIRSAGPDGKMWTNDDLILK
jgi:hypothetical protein